jgi:glycosyltransferase involved in cell wall biosynthesis
MLPDNGPTQRWLWLTLGEPDPVINGQYLFSGGLINALAAAGAELDVLALSRPEGHRHDGEREGNIRWHLAEHRPRTNWQSLVSPLPHMANQARTPEMRQMLDRLIGAADWRAIVFDSLTTGWALRPVLRRHADAARRPPLIYIAHNIESSVSRHLAKARRRWLRRRVAEFDARKVARLEQRLCRHVDIIVANTPGDCAIWQARFPDKRIEFLPPGYDGHRVTARRIGPDVPRRAVILGSFDWLAKRINLETFLRAADPLFAAAGIELLVVGSAEPDYLARLRQSTRATTFTGRVDDIGSYLAQSRIGIHVERIGGGFKLKVLDYVFHRLPIAALEGSVLAMPLRPGESLLEYGDHAALAAGVVRLIDDFATLNRLQDAAYATCEPRFDWLARGRQLIAAALPPELAAVDWRTAAQAATSAPASASETG